jgi:hypothetical protein
MKKFLPVIIVIIVLLLIVGGAFWFLRGGSSTTEPEEVPEQLAPEWTLEERPYVTLTPREDGHEFKLRIEGIKDTKLIDYELVYFANDISRGVTGTLELEGKTFTEKDLLLGSCSRNVCKYDENVSEGTLSLRFQNPEGKVRKYEVAFHLQTGDEAAAGLTSGDGGFSFQRELPAGQYYLTMTTIGLPQLPERELVAGSYGIFTSASKKVEGKITFKLEEEVEGGEILAWDGAKKTWKELTSQFKENVISAEVSSLSAFIVIASE